MPPEKDARILSAMARALRHRDRTTSVEPICRFPPTPDSPTPTTTATCPVRSAAGAGPAGVAISAVETTAPDELPRRGAPVPRELELDGGAEAVTQHALSQRAIGMCGEPGEIDPSPTTTATCPVLSAAGAPHCWRASPKRAR